MEKPVKGVDTGFDYIDTNGDIRTNAPERSVQVTAKADLAKLGKYLPGTVAYLPNMTGVWTKKADGTWGAIIE